MFGVGKLERALMPDKYLKSLIVRNPDKDRQRSATSYCTKEGISIQNRIDPKGNIRNSTT